MPLWTIKSPPWPDNNFQVMKPIEVLLEHDVPLTFTFRDTAGRLMLAHFCDSAGDRWRYIVAASNERIIHRLKTGTESIRDAIDQREMWVVDVGRNERVLSAWAITVPRLPHDALPAPDVMLYPDLDPNKRSHNSGSAVPPPVVSPGFALAA
jgi:hypothetical protein